VEVEDPALDLPLCLAVASAYRGRALPADLAAFGEVGLAGEVRGAGSTLPRLQEASALGFARCVLPASDMARLERPPEGVTAVPVRSLAEAVEILFP
jgi:DNA repair protein RadA/Sms